MGDMQAIQTSVQISVQTCVRTPAQACAQACVRRWEQACVRRWEQAFGYTAFGKVSSRRSEPTIQGP